MLEVYRCDSPTARDARVSGPAECTRAPPVTRDYRGLRARG